MNATPCPPAIPFHGHELLVSHIDAAVAQGDPQAVTAALQGLLCSSIRDPAIRLPDCVHAPVADHYARRELYRSRRLGYSVVAMTWGPGQGTPIHDHSGLWCVEGVWDGQLEITRYELLEREGERFRFRSAGALEAGTGSAGSLIPPHEYHTIRNPSAEAVAVSLHIYQAPIESCSMFRPTGGEWFLRVDNTLRTDAA